MNAHSKIKDAIQLAVSIFKIKTPLNSPPLTAEVVSRSPPCPADAECFPSCANKRRHFLAHTSKPLIRSFNSPSPTVPVQGRRPATTQSENTVECT